MVTSASRPLCTGRLEPTFYLTFLLTFLLAYLLTYFLAFLQTFLLTYLQTFLLTYLLTLFLVFFWHSFLTYFLEFLLAFLLNIFWHSFWLILHSFLTNFLTFLLAFLLTYLWHMSWHLFWHSFWHIFWHSFWHIFDISSDISSDILSGIFSDVLSDISSGIFSGGWGLAPPTPLASSPLRPGAAHCSRAYSWDPAMPIAIYSWRRWRQAEAEREGEEEEEEEEEKEEEEEEEEEEEGEDSSYKSNNPHVTGGEKLIKLILDYFGLILVDFGWFWSIFLYRKPKRSVWSMFQKGNFNCSEKTSEHDQRTLSHWWILFEPTVPSAPKAVAQRQPSSRSCLRFAVELSDGQGGRVPQKKKKGDANGTIIQN